MRCYRKCAVIECERIVGHSGAKDFCPLHYRRFKIYGDPLYTKFHKKCSVVNCELNKTTKLGYCTKHYKRYTNGKNPNLPSSKEPRKAIDMGDHCLIMLGVNAKDGYAILDKEFMYLDKYNWSLKNNGYPQATINKISTMMHHAVIGKPTKPYVTDHINRNKQDNRKINLRFVTERENALNKRYAK